MRDLNVRDAQREAGRGSARWGWRVIRLHHTNPKESDTSLASERVSNAAPRHMDPTTA